MKFMFLVLSLGLVLSGCTEKYPAKLVKIYSEDVGFFNAGETFTFAKVESMPLCMSIANAYNFARTSNDPKAGDFGALNESYYFSCQE